MQSAGVTLTNLCKLKLAHMAMDIDETPSKINGFGAQWVF